MRFVKIYDRNGWELTSYGNGWAYCLVDRMSNKSVWLQDDDAHDFASRVMDEDGWLVDNAEERFGDYSDIMQSK